MISREELDEYTKKVKKRAKEYIAKEQLVGVMNNTKWEEFRNAMVYEMPFPPPYILKTIYENEDDSKYYTHFNKEVNYLGAYDAESFAGLQYYLIEWVKVRPKYYENQGGRLVSHKVIYEAEEEFKQILKKYSIPYKVENGMYIIYGYSRSLKTKK